MRAEPPQEAARMKNPPTMTCHQPIAAVRFPFSRSLRSSSSRSILSRKPSTLSQTRPQLSLSSDDIGMSKTPSDPGRRTPEKMRRERAEILADVLAPRPLRMAAILAPCVDRRALVARAACRHNASGHHASHVE